MHVTAVISAQNIKQLLMSYADQEIVTFLNKSALFYHKGYNFIFDN